MKMINSVRITGIFALMLLLVAGIPAKGKAPVAEEDFTEEFTEEAEYDSEEDSADATAEQDDAARKVNAIWLQPLLDALPGPEYSHDETELQREARKAAEKEQFDGAVAKLAGRVITIADARVEDAQEERIMTKKGKAELKRKWAQLQKEVRNDPAAGMLIDVDNPDNPMTTYFLAMMLVGCKDCMAPGPGADVTYELDYTLPSGHSDVDIKIKRYFADKRKAAALIKGQRETMKVKVLGAKKTYSGIEIYVQ